MRKEPHLAVHHLGLLGPIPHGEHVIVGFVHGTEQIAPILGEEGRRGRGKVSQDPDPAPLNTSPTGTFSTQVRFKVFKGSGPCHVKHIKTHAPSSSHTHI